MSSPHIPADLVREHDRLASSTPVHGLLYPWPMVSSRSMVSKQLASTPPLANGILPLNGLKTVACRILQKWRICFDFLENLGRTQKEFRQSAIRKKWISCRDTPRKWYDPVQTCIILTKINAYQQAKQDPSVVLGRWHRARCLITAPDGAPMDTDQAHLVVNKIGK